MEIITALHFVFVVYPMYENADFHSEIGTSSVCTSQITVLDDADADSVGLLRVDLYDTRVEAFRGNTTNTDFSVMGKLASSDVQHFRYQVAGHNRIAQALKVLVGLMTV
jgi:hypothetical protein